MKIAISTSTPSLEPAAHRLADSLQLPFLSSPEEQEEYNYILLLTPKYLGLRKTGEKSLPLYVDFLAGKITYRRQHASLRHEALARALGLNHKSSPIIIDATAGLGQDSFILASLGFEITLLERSPIIHALLQDGILRALANSHVAPIVSRLHLIQTNAISWLKTCSDQPDIIYMDPMFPERQKSALVKKEMRVIHDILGEDPDDAEALFNTARTCAKKRVVVKRPRLAAPIAGLSPAFDLKGSSSRFDVYLI